MRWRRREGGGPRTGYRGPGGAADRPGRRALRGAVLASLVWVGLARLGVQDVLGIRELHPLPLVAVVGAVLALRGWLAPVWSLGALATGALLVVTTTPVVRPLVDSVRVPSAARDAAGTDAVFVFSASVTDDGLVAGQGPERLLHGIALARDAEVPLVVSAVRPHARREASSERDQRALAALAGIADRLVVVDSVGSTRDEAVRLAALARARGWRRITAVTSPLHARRACASVARVGLQVRCAPAPSRELALDGADPLNGTEERARAFGLWLYEAIGMLVYRVRGWA